MFHSRIYYLIRNLIKIFFYKYTKTYTSTRAHNREDGKLKKQKNKTKKSRRKITVKLNKYDIFIYASKLFTEMIRRCVTYKTFNVLHSMGHRTIRIEESI